MPEELKEVSLKVAEALQIDYAKRIVRLDANARKILGVTTGDVVEIKGKKVTAAIVLPAHPQDEGLNIIRMDGILRQNTSVGLGDSVRVKKAEIKEAKKIVLAPNQPTRYAPGFEQFVKKNLVGKPLSKGDLLSINVFGTSFPFAVAQTVPAGLVLVGAQTNLELREEPVKELGKIATLSYEDIGGLKDEVQKIREMVELPMRHPELFERLGIEPPKGVLIYGTPGCITGDSLIALEDGRLVKMEEIARGLQPNIYVADLPVYPPASATKLITYDAPETMELVSETGKRLRMTPDHPLLTKQGWVEAEKLKAGDEIKTIEWIPSPQNKIPVAFNFDFSYAHNKKIAPPKEWDETLGFLMGAFVAEGNVWKSRVTFTIHQREEEFKQAIIVGMKQYGNILEKISKPREKNSIGIRFEHTTLAKFFEKYHVKEIPAPILLSPNSVCASFLKGLFEGDGCAVLLTHRRVKKIGGKKYENMEVSRSVSLKSSSRILLEQVQTLLLRWRIRAYINDSFYKTADGRTKEAFVLYIRGKENLEKFMTEIGFLSTQKSSKLEAITRSFKNKIKQFNPSEFEKIKSIEKKHGWTRVYDFEVPSTNAFFSNGILSHNCGKTLLARAVANESEAHFITINGPEIVSKFVGEAEERLRGIFKDAEENAPSIIFIDEIDSIAPKREEVTGEVEKRIVSQLLSSMDGLKSRGQVVVIAATNRQNSLDPALRRPGRFDREIEIGVPDKAGRKEILQIHTRGMPLAPDVSLDDLAAHTHGFVGADLQLLTKEAAMKALRRTLPKIKVEDAQIPQEILDSMRVTSDDFQYAQREIRPSALREVYVEVPNVKWDEIGGLERAKQEIRDSIELPLKNPKVFTKLGIRPARGILLFGPSGTGKTLLAKAAATESEANFIVVRGPEIVSKWIGESEKNVREVFRKARVAAPCILLFDEIDSITHSRGGDNGRDAIHEPMVNTFLAEMDGIQESDDVIVIGTTNQIHMIDSALLRPGRFDKLIAIPLPDEGARLSILKVHTKKMPLAKDVDLKALAKKTEGYSGADLEGLCREAGMIALRENINAKEIRMDHFQKVMSETRATLEMKRVEEERKEEAKTGYG